LKQNRIVLTGGPGTGKTSIVNALKTKGHFCFEEISREIIQEEMEKGSDVLPWDNLDAFSERVISGRLKQYESAPEGISFYDRSIVDSIAYLHLDELPVNTDWHQLALSHQYNKVVFITPPWKEIYETDNERKESFNKLIDLHEILWHTYEEYGYRLVEVPRMTIEERVNFIENQLNF
jgi:predicted ATPase